MATKKASKDVESSQFGVITVEKIQDKYQNYSNSTCGSNVMETYTFYGGHLKKLKPFYIFRLLIDKASSCQRWCLYQHLKRHFAYHTALKITEL